MIFEHIRSEGLAHNSYLVGSRREAALIDPKRDCWEYLDIARENELKITHIFETHRNEDYVIGSLELSEIVDAEIYHGPNLDFEYGNTVKEGDIFEIGSLKLKILETPGHTDESISIIIEDPDVSNDPYMVFTGDALFAGDVGRTDLYGYDERERMANTLYSTLHNKLLQLNDGTIVCPAHGQGSVCGEEISDHPITTIEYEKKNNPLLQLDKDEFIEKKKNEMIDVPPYFSKMEKYNKSGAPILHNLPELDVLSVDELKEYKDKGAQIVDIRSPSSFSGGHIPNSIHIWREGLPFFIGWMLNYEDPIILVDDFNQNLQEAIRHFVRLGYDNITGYLEDGFSTWFKEGERMGTVKTWTAHDLKENLEDENLFVLDVRNDKSWKTEDHIPGAEHVYVGELEDNIEKIPDNKTIVIYCDSGFKTSLAASLLKRNGFEDIVSMLGGMIAWENKGYPLK